MAKLIIGGNQKQQSDKLSQLAEENKLNLTKNNPDLLMIDPDKSIKIDQIRQTQNFLSKKSWQGQAKKTVIIKQAHLMTLPAQNAFLKTLEEPPANSEIILITNNKTSLIKTIISRCQIINLKTELNINTDKIYQQWQKLIKKNKAQRLSSKIKYTDQDYQQLIIALQQKLITNPDKKSFQEQLQLIQKARQMLKDNVQADKVVDWLMLKI